MIPLERKAKEIWSYQSSGRQAEDERTPLLAPSSEEGGMLQRYMAGSTLYEGSVGNFYSPFESPDNSDDEDDDMEVSGVRVPKRFRRKKDHPMTSQVLFWINFCSVIRITIVQEREFVKIGEEMLVTAWKILNSPDWKVEKQLDNGDRVQVKQVNGKRVFRLTVSKKMRKRFV